MEPKPEGRFRARVALVTGASQGIGEVISRQLAGEGAVVALVDVQEEKLQSVCQSIRDAGGQAYFWVADVSRFASAEKICQEVVAQLGRVDHLINNAGITRDGLLLRLKEEEWDAVLAVNLKGVFNFSKAVLRTMVNQRYGRIVNISSVVGVMGNAGQTNYAASKAGVIGFTKALAREVAGRGITVNCVAPGYISTPMTERLPEEIKKGFLDLIPMKRFGQPEDVAAAVLFLLSDAASYITGQVIHVNGGMYM